MKLHFHEEARREYREAAGYYRKIRKKLANEFVDEVENAIQRIRSIPESWLMVDGNIRRYLLRRFPYGIYYLLGDEYIEVFAVMHLSRKPGYWRDRL